jgi:hypothetical protein
MALSFTGPPSAVIVNSNTPFVPTPATGGLAEESSETSKDLVTTQIRAAHLSNRAEYKFEDVPLFIIEHKDYNGTPLHMIHSLYYLNWQVREACMAAYKGYTQLFRGPTRKRGTTDANNDNVGLFQEQDGTVTINSVARAIRYFGYQVASMGQDDKRLGTTGVSGLGRYRMFTTQLQGKVDYVPNIFQRQTTDKHKEAIEEGDLVGFSIQRVPWKMYSTNWEGEQTQILAHDHPDTCVQIVPVAGEGGCIPLESGNENASYNFETIGSKTFKVNVPAIFIPVGRVIRISPQPVGNEAKKDASCQYESYEMMKTRRQTVDLYLNARYPFTWGI